MTLAIDLIDGHVLSNKVHLAKKEQGNLVLPNLFTVKGVYPAVHY